MLEDIHWADDSSLDLLDILAKTIKSNFFILSCSRPSLFERRPHWGEGLNYHKRLNLEPLARRDSRKLVEEILKNAKSIPRAFRNQVVQRTEGNPFFVEEFIKLLIENNVISTGNTWHIETDSEGIKDIPTTLTGVIQTRLARLSKPELHILQQASVAGNQFWEGVLQSCSGLDKIEIQGKLEMLRRREMIFRLESSSVAQTNEYVFKHDILRQVTYESIETTKRRKIHRLVAGWLIDQSTDSRTELLGPIGDHFEHAQIPEKASHYLTLAGDQAATQFANAEAETYYSRALNLVPDNNPDTTFRLLMSREQLYNLAGPREKQKQDLDRLALLTDQIDLTKQAETALLQARYHKAIQQFPESITWTLKAIELGKIIKDKKILAAGYIQWGAVLTEQKNTEGLPQFKQALDLARAAKAPREEAESLNSLAVFYRKQLDYQQSIQFYKQALEIHCRIDNKTGEQLSLRSLGELTVISGDYKEAALYCRQSLHITREIGDRFMEAWDLISLGDTYFFQGNSDKAQQYFDKSLQLAKEVGEQSCVAWALFALGDVALATGDYTKAQTLFDEDLRIQQNLKNQFGQGWACCYQAISAMYMGMFDKAEEGFNRALSLFEKTQNKIGEARTYSFASLLYHYQSQNLPTSPLKSELEAKAEEYINKSLPVSKGLSQLIHSFTLTHQGNILKDRQPDKAEKAYQTAFKIRQEQNLPHLAMSPLAGLAELSLKRGDLQTSLSHTKSILKMLKSHQPAGTVEPARIFLTCYQVLLAHKHSRALSVLLKGYRLLERWGNRITSPEIQNSFFQNIPDNRNLLNTVRQLTAEKY